MPEQRYSYKLCHHRTIPVGPKNKKLFHLIFRYFNIRLIINEINDNFLVKSAVFRLFNAVKLKVMETSYCR